MGKFQYIPNQEVFVNQIQKYIDHYENKLSLAASYAKKNEKGFVRSTMGELVEGMLDLIWTDVVGGSSKKNDYVVSKSTSGIKLKFQVDRHLYTPSNTLVALGECKAYLDRCFMERASSDFSRITRGLKQKPATFILALEQATGKDAFQYYMDEGHIDHIFFLCDGIRSPKKPIWNNNFYKPINRKSLQSFVSFIESMR